jgi:hypothetical protein
LKEWQRGSITWGCGNTGSMAIWGVWQYGEYGNMVSIAIKTVLQYG